MSFPTRRRRESSTSGRRIGLLNVVGHAFDESELGLVPLALLCLDLRLGPRSVSFMLRRQNSRAGSNSVIGSNSAIVVTPNASPMIQDDASKFEVQGR